MTTRNTRNTGNTGNTGSTRATRATGTTSATGAANGARDPGRPAPRRRKGAAPSATPLTDQYIARGEWNPLWDYIRSLDPEFIEAYLAFRSVPHRKGPLPPRFKELILIAVNVATTHLYAPGARRHMQNALRLGATPEEILEVIELTTVMGIHSVNLAVPILCEELAKRDAAGAPATTPARPRARAAAPAKRVAGRAR